MLFCCKNAENGVGQNVSQLPAPHRGPHRLAVSGFAAYCQLMPHGYAEMHGKGERAPERKQFPLRYSLNLSAHFRVWVTVWVRRLTHILTHTIFSVFATKKHRKPKFSMLFGAAGQIRTADLILTKDALYLLSYSSKWRPGRGSNPRPPA